MKTLVIIPAFNEERNIEHVVRNLNKHTPELDVLVVNDGSSDSTARVARESGAEVITLPVNLGIGGAVQTGFLYACSKGYDIALQVDGDGQHRPDEIRKILRPIINGEADAVIGSRFLQKTSYKGTFSRRLGIYILSHTIKQVVRKTYTDPTSGFRAYNRKALHILSQHYSIDYPEPDSIVTLLRNHLNVIEVSVEMEPRLHGKSSITPFKSLYYMFKVSLAIILSSMMNRIWREEFVADSDHSSLG